MNLITASQVVMTHITASKFITTLITAGELVMIHIKASHVFMALITASHVVMTHITASQVYLDQSSVMWTKVPDQSIVKYC